MMKTLMTSAALLMAASGAIAETYVLDPTHTEVRFYWNHAGLTEQHGEWLGIAGTIEFDADNVTATSADITIDPASIHTGVVALDDELKGEMFFNAEAYPEIRFTSTSAVQTGAETLRLIGDLTVKDNTHSAVLDVNMKFMGTHPLGGYFDFYQGEWIGVEATSSLLRSEYGVGLYAPLTSDVVRLEISAEMRAGGWPAE
ncbi:YceI family protein [Thalassobius sp. I31.1]|uniref:YceI family protein n=1 Tax=Thalassobius sp. I31.1 TaxID=2109912 RepID=UPI000D19B1AB|nr:YceI family protein [Thalassobius sp. I31.1]